MLGKPRSKVRCEARNWVQEVFKKLKMRDKKCFLNLFNLTPNIYIYIIFFNNMCGGRTEPPTLRLIIHVRSWAMLIFTHVTRIWHFSLITTNHTCKSPWPSALKVTEGGDGCRAIRTLDPGHSRSSIASFSAADWYLNNKLQLFFFDDL